MITSQKLIVKALRRIAPMAGPEEVARLREALAVQIDTALAVLGKRVAASDDFRALQKVFAGNGGNGGQCVNGVVNLAAAAFDGILFVPARAKVKVSGVSHNSQFVENYEMLEWDVLPRDLTYFGQYGSKLHFLNTDGSLTTLGGAGANVDITANFTPTLNDINSKEHEDALVEILVEKYLDAARGDNRAAREAALEGAQQGRV